ncbi:hypothetical protein SK3146_00667 [Paenibacillus konkukensis]|uniref:Uncharacterized protein n=1 Tax=Paenibacillus konkukensis TaxID=2020716 RepID=A0ABY4RGC4_9BACL|nr:hypothetical protein [Paenibacillus konkukensis]UQZ81511.1 hypothetical protein SK3146_00667 [Paenibacillus konkukensis]
MKSILHITAIDEGNGIDRRGFVAILPGEEDSTLQKQEKGNDLKLFLPFLRIT